MGFGRRIDRQLRKETAEHNGPGLGRVNGCVSGVSSSPRNPEHHADNVQGILWAEGVASGTVRLPEDGDRFIEQFNAAYGSHGLILQRSDQVRRASG